MSNEFVARKGLLVPSGNVGIGTTSPAAKLDIAGGDLYVRTGGTTFTNTLSPYSGNMTIALGGSGNNLIVSGGNVGIGVTPSAWNTSYKALDIGDSFGLLGGAAAGDLYFNAYLNASSQFIYKTTGAASAYSLATGAHRWYTAPSGTAGNAITLTQAMTLDNSGGLGIGTTSPSAKLNVSGDIHIGDYGSAASRVLDFRTSNSLFTITTDGTAAALGTTITYSWASGGQGALKFNNAGGEVMRLTSTGLLIVPSIYTNNTGGSPNVFVGTDGTLARTTSSLKYKKNVQDYTKGLAEVMQMRPVTYNSKNISEEGITYAGLIAEEIHELGLTEFVEYAPDKSPDALRYANIVALLVKGMQEQQQQIELLKNELETLKNK